VASKKDEENTTVTGYDPDTLDMKTLRRIAANIERILGQDKDIQDLFAKAYAGDYDGASGKDRFEQDMERLDWWNNNSANLRRYIVLSANPNNEDFKQQQEDSYEAVRQFVMQYGVNLTDQQKQDLAEQNLMYGWLAEGRDYELIEAIDELELEDGQYGGDIAANANNLKQLAFQNGVYFDDQWYDSAGKSIASSLSLADSWEKQIRDQAASKFPVFAEQIQMGANVASIASPYVRMMADTLELNPAAITLDDPTIMGALTNYDDAGKPRAVNLGDFGRQLRNDPRWENTDKAQNEITGIVGRVAQMFGIM